MKSGSNRRLFVFVLITLLFTQLKGIMAFGSTTESCTVSKAEAMAAADAISIEKENLAALISKCEEKNINTPYESALLEIIEKFSGYADEEIAGGYYEQVVSYSTDIHNLAVEAKDRLDMYLLGTEEPFAVPEYIIGGISADKIGLRANTSLGERHILQSGYNVMSLNYDETEFFRTIGLNYMSISMPIDEFVTKPVAKNWVIKDSNENNGIETTLISESALNGNYSLKICGGGNDGYSILCQTIRCEPETSYKIGVSYTSDSALSDTWFHVNGITSSGRQKLSPALSKNAQSFTYVTSKNQTQMEFILFFGSQEASELIVDDVYIRKQNTRENLLLNNDFEQGPPNTDGKNYYICESELSKIGHMLENAEKNSIAVNIGLGLHRLPTYLYNIYDDLTCEGIRSNTYFPFNPDHTAARTLISDFLDIVIPYISRYSAVSDIVVSNEPEFNSGNSDYYKTRWKEYLEDLYRHDISALNAVYKTNYKTFSEVPLIKRTLASDRSSWDWKNFNDSIMTGYHCFVTEKIRENSSLPLYSKMMKYTVPYERFCYLKHGVNAIEFSSMMDYNGCDSSARLPSEDVGEFNHTINNMLWYDYLTSIKEAPVFNLEEHYIADGNEMMYQNSYADYIANGIWEGAIHGVTTHAIWLWYRSASSGFKNSSMAFRPDCVAKISETAMDMSRLSEEIYTLASSKSPVGILYAQPSQIFTSHYLDALNKSYKALVGLGQKPQIINDCDRTIEGIDLLVVPCAVNVTETTLKAIIDFANKGGRILILGNNSLSFDEYNNPLNPQLQTSLLSTDAVVRYDVAANGVFIADDIRPIIKTDLSECGLLKVEVLGDTDDAGLSDVTYCYADTDDGFIMDIANYSETETKFVKLNAPDYDAKSAVDLISGAEMGEEFYLMPGRHMLLKMKKNPLNDLVGYKRGAYDFKNVMVKSLHAEGSTISIGWRNPMSATLSAVRLYVEENGEYRLLEDNFSCEPDKVMEYSIKGLNAGQLYTLRLEAEFTDSNYTNYTVSAVPKTHSGQINKYLSDGKYWSVYMAGKSSVPSEPLTNVLLEDSQLPLHIISDKTDVNTGALGVRGYFEIDCDAIAYSLRFKIKGSKVSGLSVANAVGGVWIAGKTECIDFPDGTVIEKKINVPANTTANQFIQFNICGVAEDLWIGGVELYAIYSDGTIGTKNLMLDGDLNKTKAELKRAQAITGFKVSPEENGFSAVWDSLSNCDYINIYQIRDNMPVCVASLDIMSASLPYSGGLNSETYILAQCGYRFGGFGLTDYQCVLPISASAGCGEFDVCYEELRDIKSYRASVAVKNNGASDNLHVWMIIALYDSDGALVKCGFSDIEKINMRSDAKVVTAYCNIPSKEECTVKAFLWDGTKNLLPLINQYQEQ